MSFMASMWSLYRSRMARAILVWHLMPSMVIIAPVNPLPFEQTRDKCHFVGLGLVNLLSQDQLLLARPGGYEVQRPPITRTVMRVPRDLFVDSDDLGDG